jgi:hypothetical protein
MVCVAKPEVLFPTSSNFQFLVSAAGCIYANESSSLAILDSNFTNNFGLAAGAAALWNSTATINNTVFSNNTCNSAGSHTISSEGAFSLPSMSKKVVLEQWEGL